MSSEGASAERRSSIVLKHLHPTYSSSSLEEICSTYLKKQRTTSPNIALTVADLKPDQKNELILSLLSHAEKQDEYVKFTNMAAWNTSVPDLVAEILTELPRIMMSRAATVYLYERDTGKMQCHYLKMDDITKDVVTEMTESKADIGIVGWVMKNLKPALVEEAPDDPRYSEEADNAHALNPENMLTVPVVRGERFIGVLQVMDKLNGDPYNNSDTSMMLQLSHHLSAIIASAHLTEQVRVSQQQNSKLRTMISNVTTQLELLPLLDCIIENVMEIFDAEWTTMFLYDENTGMMWSRMPPSPPEGSDRSAPGTPQVGVAAGVYKTGQPVRIVDPMNDPRFNPEADKKSKKPTRGLICVPITHNGSVTGVLQLVNKKHGQFDEIDVENIMSTVSALGMAIENAKKFEDVRGVSRYSGNLLNSLNTGVVATDDEGLIDYCNKVFLDTVGITEADVIGRPVGDILMSGGSEGANSALIESLKHGITNQTEVRVDSAEVTFMVSSQGEATPAKASGKEKDSAKKKKGKNNKNNTKLIKKTMNVLLKSLIEVETPENTQEPDAQGEKIGYVITFDPVSQELSFLRSMERYTGSANVANSLIPVREEITVGAQRDATIFFVNICGFVSLSKRCGPRESVEILNDYIMEINDIVTAFGGVMHQHRGDTLLCAFGFPAQDESHADHAVVAAVEICTALRRFNTRRKTISKEPISISVGIHTGEVTVGAVSNHRRLEFVILGDTVNIAAELEEANKTYGTELTISDYTRSRLKNTFVTRLIDRVYVNQHPTANAPPSLMQMYQVLDYYSADEFPERIRCSAHFDAGIEYYNDQKWDNAARSFQAVLRLHQDDMLSKIYLGRCIRFIDQPPVSKELWNGVCEYPPVVRIQSKLGEKESAASLDIVGLEENYNDRALEEHRHDDEDDDYAR